MISKCILESDTYKLSVTTKFNQSIVAILAITCGNKAYSWHQRLGHIIQKQLKHIQLMSKGIETFDENKITLCTPCIQGKKHKKFKNHNKKIPKEGGHRSTELFRIVHFDINGPLQTGTHSGCEYFITFIDD